MKTTKTKAVKPDAAIIDKAKKSRDKVIKSNKIVIK